MVKDVFPGWSIPQEILYESAITIPLFALQIIVARPLLCHFCWLAQSPYNIITVVRKSGLSMAFGLHWAEQGYSTKSSPVP